MIQVDLTSGGMTAEADLVSRARNRDEAAVREITNRHNRRLYRIARGILGNSDEAEDAVQEAYLRAFTGLDRFRGESSLGTWLTRIVMNEALGRVRRRRPSVALDAVERHDERGRPQARREVIAMASGENPETLAARSEIQTLVDRSIDRLPDDFRAVFVARMVEGLSIAETAELFGVRPETVKTRVHRASRRLRADLARQLGPTVQDAFPFDGARCERLTENVLRALGVPDSRPLREPSARSHIQP